jgi:hypothetical protein
VWIFGPDAPLKEYNLICQTTVVQWFVVVPNAATPAAPAVTGADLATRAFSSFRVSAPVPHMAPAPNRVVVQLATWLWVDGWRRQTATATVPGLTATVTAVPTKVTWMMGDGGRVTCTGPGTPYDPNRPYEDQSTDCSYAYHKSSAGQPGDAYTGSVAISYGTSWAATDGTGGALAPLTATATFTVRVGEIQAINS